MPTTDRTTRQICWLIVLAGLSLIAGQIATVRATTGDVPFFSANDRSRWSTVAALVDYRTYKIDHFQNIRDPKKKRRTWQSIDRVRHRDSDGNLHDYSSKPPLLATLVAGVYAVVKGTTGWAIQEHTFTVARIILAAVNLPLMAILLACVTSLILRYSRTVFGTVLLVLAISFASLLTPFAISLNNHLPAATSAALALWLLERQSRTGTGIWSMLACGLAIAFMVTNELPSLAMLAVCVVLAFWLSPRHSLVGLFPGMGLVAVAFFMTNWWAHESLRPPYAHRGVGAAITDLPIDVEANAVIPELAERHREEIAVACGVMPNELEISASRKPGRLRLDTPSKTFALVVADQRLQLRQWDDWYDYPGTYWSDQNRKGIDLGEPDRAIYAFHLLLGHHGIFSLTPIWGLSVIGIGLWLRGFEIKRPSWLQLAVIGIALVWLVCLVFYISRPLIDRNYGGVSVGFRWLLWMAPLWIVLAIPAADRFAESRWGRIVCMIGLAVSLFGVATALDNPWAHPWIYRLFDSANLP